MADSGDPYREAALLPDVRRFPLTITRRALDRAYKLSTAVYLGLAVVVVGIVVVAAIRARRFPTVSLVLFSSLPLYERAFRDIFLNRAKHRESLLLTGLTNRLLRHPDHAPLPTEAIIGFGVEAGGNGHVAYAECVIDDQPARWALDTCRTEPEALALATDLSTQLAVPLLPSSNSPWRTPPTQTTSSLPVPL